jgi:hypothetical protein
MILRRAFLGPENGEGSQADLSFLRKLSRLIIPHFSALEEALHDGALVAMARDA